MIGSDDYKFITDRIGNARGDIKKALGLLNVMSDDLARADMREKDIDRLKLLNTIASTYLFVVGKYRDGNNQLNTLIQRLQNHVAHRFGTVDGYLSSSGIQVTQDFAELSAAIGYPIAEENIEEASV